MKLWQALTLIIGMFILTIGLVVNIWMLRDAPPLFYEERAVLPYTFMVDDVSGMDLGQDVFRFGAVTPGNRAYRNLTIGQNDSSEVHVFAVGDGSEFITPNRVVFSLGVDHTSDIRFVVTVPENASLGVYNGSLVFYFK